VKTIACPECLSVNLIKFGTKFIRDTKTNKRYRIQQHQCKNCGRITIKPIIISS